MQPEKLTYSVKEAAAVMGVSVSTVTRALNGKQIPHMRIGTRILIPKLALENMLADPQLGRAPEPEADRLVDTTSYYAAQKAGAGNG